MAPRRGGRRGRSSSLDEVLLLEREQQLLLLLLLLLLVVVVGGWLSLLQLAGEIERPKELLAVGQQVLLVDAERILLLGAGQMGRLRPGKRVRRVGGRLELIGGNHHGRAAAATAAWVQLRLGLAGGWAGGACGELGVKVLRNQLEEFLLLLLDLLRGRHPLAGTVVGRRPVGAALRIGHRGHALAAGCFARSSTCRIKGLTGCDSPAALASSLQAIQSILKPHTTSQRQSSGRRVCACKGRAHAESA